MKKLIIASCALAAIASVAFGGTETYQASRLRFSRHPVHSGIETPSGTSVCGEPIYLLEHRIGTIPISESTMPGGAVAT